MLSQGADHSATNGNKKCRCISWFTPRNQDQSKLNVYLGQESPEGVLWQSCMHACMHVLKQVGLIQCYENEIWEVVFCFCWIVGKKVRQSPSFSQKNPFTSLCQFNIWAEMAFKQPSAGGWWCWIDLARQVISAQNPHNIALYWSVHKVFTNGLWPNTPYISLGRISFPIYSNQTIH